MQSNVPQLTSAPLRLFGLGEKIGSGGYSHVFKGTNTSTGAVCAIKKSRASLTLKRTVLKHEANILKRLGGHPAIPELYGYGHLEHFEYLAIKLLGKPLSDQDKFALGFSIQEVADIGVQLLSALKHIHSHGIVHRDIKPQNILARRGTDFSHLYIIDFGLARRRLSGTPCQVDLAKERINARRSDLLSDLNPRDDLESLAFILLYLLRGSLPWHKLCRAGTAVTRITQIRSKLLSWNGARLGEGYSSAFGKLLDYARHLGFDEPIDYEGFRSDFKKLRDSKVQTNRNVGPGKTFTSLSPEASPIAELTGLRPSITKNFPAAAGDLVLVQIDMRTSVEGYTFREDNSCYRPDPSLSGGSWKAPFRPALILSRKAQEGGRCSFWLIPLTKRTPKGAISLKGIGVDDLPESLSKLSAYVFPRAIEIYTLPSHAPVSSRWKLPRSTIKNLWGKLDSELLEFDHSKTEDSDPDVRHEMRLLMQHTILHANLLPLDSSPHTEIDWTGVRGWFDECVKVGRRRGWEDGFFWTGHPVDEVSLDDSYCGGEIWWDFRQQERDAELEIDGEDAEDLPLIDEVVKSY